MTNILLIALALALDAFGVALGLGCGNRLSLEQKTKLIFSFGFFQFLFVLVGALLGSYIDANFFSISDYLSGVIILVLGFFLLKEGYENDEACSTINLSNWMYIVLGIGVSIDALGVGFSVFYKLDYLSIFYDSIIVGVIALSLTLLSLTIVEYIKCFSFIRKYADYLGGLILVIFGIKMMM